MEYGSGKNREENSRQNLGNIQTHLDRNRCKYKIEKRQVYTYVWTV